MFWDNPYLNIMMIGFYLNRIFSINEKFHISRKLGMQNSTSDAARWRCGSCHISWREV
jgi:hypothetical protein